MDVRGLRDLVTTRFPEYLAELETMVNIDSGSFSPAGVNRVVDRCEQRFRAFGWDVERHEHEPAPGAPRLGDLLIGRRLGTGGTKVLLVGHTDTVFDDGTAAERPFRVEGSRARGPGVSDMKAGLLTGFFAMHALQDAGLETFEHVTFVCNPDEEIGSPFSGPAIHQQALRHDVGLVLEGARANGDIVSARKATTDYVLTVLGRAAHAGVEPEKGRSAITAAAALVGELQALNGSWPGVTVNVGTIDGGTRTNVVAARCSLQVDLRSPTVESLEAAQREIERLCASPAQPDITIEVVRDAGHRPMEKTPAIAALVERAVGLAAELDFDLRDAATGGMSDANTIAAAGVPVIDGLGPVGGDDHAPAEWLDLDSVVPRTALLAGLIGLR
ncbi:MAG: M20 family metallopeptidase [Actinomycetota bacterium]